MVGRVGMIQIVGKATNWDICLFVCFRLTTIKYNIFIQPCFASFKNY